MLQEERMMKIVEYLKKHNSARYKELAELVSVSESTLRKDLAVLEQHEVIRVVRGGAVWGKSDLTRGKLITREIIHKKEKEELVRGLGAILKNGQAVSINGGTTTNEAARFIRDNYVRMTIITNSLAVEEILKENKGFNIILTSGLYFDDEKTLEGFRAEYAFNQYNTDCAIIGINNISLEKGVTDFREEVYGIVNAMIANTKKSIIVADHTKFETFAYRNICDIDSIDYYLTDSGIDKDIFDMYKSKGVNMLVSDSI